MPKESLSQRGFSLIETAIALGVLTVGLMGAAAVLTSGLNIVQSSPFDLIATQKAAEAVESVFSGRDSHVLVWAQIENVLGASGSDGGVFLDGAQPIKLVGPDGLVNTADDATQPIETMVFPGPDQMMYTADDITVTLAGMTRAITIRNVPGEIDVNGICDLRSITVTVVYYAGTTARTYTLVTYISNYS
jgi:prepilin-type N-terminal cleavage/methylation domain-containing protein